MKTIAALALTLLLAGCATNYANKTPQQVAAAIKVSTSEFDSSIMYVGPAIISVTRRGLFEDNERTHLVALRDKKTNAMRFLVRTDIMYPFDWRFYNSVSFTDGSTTTLEKTDRHSHGCEALGCIHSELAVFEIDYKRLVASNDGLRFRLNGKSAQNQITVTKSYIEGFTAGIGALVAAGR